MNDSNQTNKNNNKHNNNNDKHKTNKQKQLITLIIKQILLIKTTNVIVIMITIKNIIRKQLRTHEYK